MATASGLGPIAIFMNWAGFGSQNPNLDARSKDLGEDGHATLWCIGRRSPPPQLAAVSFAAPLDYKQGRAALPADSNRVRGPRSQELLLDAMRDFVHVPEIGRQRLVIGHVNQEFLTDHVFVFEAGDGERRGETIHDVVAVVFLRVEILVLVEGVAPLEGSAQWQVGLRV